MCCFFSIPTVGGLAIAVVGPESFETRGWRRGRRGRLVLTHLGPAYLVGGGAWSFGTSGPPASMVEGALRKRRFHMGCGDF